MTDNLPNSFTLRCPSCGSTMGLPDAQGVAQCGSCGTKVVLQATEAAKENRNLSRYQELCKVANQAKNWEDLLKYANEILEIDPKNADVHTDMGSMYRKKRDYDRAVAEFKKAAEVDPRHVNSRYNLGIVLLHDKQDIKGAIKAWEDYLRVEPTGPRAENIRNQMDKMKAMVK